MKADSVGGAGVTKEELKEVVEEGEEVGRRSLS